MQTKAYGKLCSLFYDATKQFAPEKEINFYESFIKQNPGRVLEAMSGSGRLQIPLLQRGYEVDGIDNSRIMLDRCLERAAKLNISPIVYEQSLENMDLPHKYTNVTIAVGSFQLITDKAAALNSLKNLHRHMEKGGNLLIDFFIPETGDSSPFIREAILDHNSKIRLTTNYKFDTKESKAFGYCKYELLIDNKVCEQEDETIAICWYTEDELQNLINQAGFEVVKIYKERFRATGDSDILHAKIS